MPRCVNPRSFVYVLLSLPLRRLSTVLLFCPHGSRICSFFTFRFYFLRLLSLSFPSLCGRRWDFYKQALSYPNIAVQAFITKVIAVVFTPQQAWKGAPTCDYFTVDGRVP
jgi:hypothetical protein